MKKLIILWITTITMMNLHSQNQNIDYPHTVPMSPNAAELAKYADIPVSHYTGVPNTSIPLYEIDIDGFKLPINLNYHASGIKVDQEATWVGLGWSLDVGSRISRTVFGSDDFAIGPNSDTNNKYIKGGYFYAPDADANRFNHYETYGKDPNQMIIDNDIFHQIYDSEPDIFYYNLPNINGKFILDKSRGAVLFDKSHNLKIEISADQLTHFIKVTDSNGVQYIYKDFEITENYIDNTTPLNKNIHTFDTVYDDSESSFVTWDGDYQYHRAPNKIQSSWCVSKIITKNGREINFKYASEKQSLPTQESCGNILARNLAGVGRDDTYYTKSKIVNKSLRLTSIDGDFGQIVFTSSDRLDINGTSEKLDEISVYNLSKNLIKYFKFNYSYFNNETTEKIKYKHVFKRLKLTNVTEHLNWYTPLNKGYNFSYYPGEFPPKNSKNVDYWGFQNGKVYGDKYYIGVYFGGNKYLGVKKDASFEKAVIGTLNKIEYPTGGTAEFKYESNKISSYFFEANTCDYDSSTKTESVSVYNNYIYNEHPHLPSQRTYKFSVENKCSLVINCNLGNDWGQQDMDYAYNSQDLAILRKISPTTKTYYRYQCPRLYDTSIEGGSGTEFSVVEHQFELDQGEYEFIALAPPKEVIASWRLHFENNNPPRTFSDFSTEPLNAGGIRISEIKTNAKTRKFSYSLGKLLIEPRLYYLSKPRAISYSTVPSGSYDDTRYFTQVSESLTPLSTFCSGNTIGYDWVAEYLTDSITNIPPTVYTFHNETESDIIDDSFANSPRYITSYRNGLITNIQKLSDNNVAENTDIQYTSTFSDYIKAFIDNGEPRLSNYLLEYNYKIEWPLKSKETIKTAFYNDDSIISETNYSYNSKDLIQTTSYKQSTASSVTPETIEKVQYPFDFTDAVSVAMVNKNMIGVTVTKETFNDDKIAAVQKIASQKTIYDIFGDIIAPKTVQTSKETAPLEDRLKYNAYDTKGNLLEVEQSNGMKVSYIWAYNKMQPVAKLDNIAYADIPPSLITAIQSAMDSPTATEANVLPPLTALRNSTDANMQKAMITTYTYIPLVGVSTITDPKGDKITYTYDSFGRLQNVKDKEGNILSENEYHYKN